MQELENELDQQVADPPVQEAPVAQPPVAEEADPSQIEGMEPPVQEPADDSSSDERSRAREMGWRPKEEWRGDPAVWRPAKEFLRRGEEVLPIVRARAQKAEAKAAELESRIGQMERSFEDRFRRLDGVSRVALQQQAQQIAQHYQTLMRDAVEKGDVERWDTLNRQYATEIGDLQQKSADAYAPKPNPQDDQPKVDPDKAAIVQDWVSGHDWWGEDEEMTDAAVFYHGRLLKSKPFLSLEDNLKKTKEFLQRAYPDRMGGAPRQNDQRPPANNGAQRQQPPHAPAVEGGTRQPGSSAVRPKSWNDLPPEAKQAGESFIRNDGLFLPTGTNPESLTDADVQKARAAYAKTYWEQA